MKVPDYQHGQKLERPQVNKEEKLAEAKERAKTGKGYHNIATEKNTKNRDAFYADYYAKHPEEASKPGVYPDPRKNKAEAAPQEAAAPATQKAATQAAATAPAAAPAEEPKASSASKPEWVTMAEYFAKNITDNYVAFEKAGGRDVNYDETYARELETWMSKGESFFNTVAKNAPGQIDQMRKNWQAAGFGLDDAPNPTPSWEEVSATSKQSSSYAIDTEDIPMDEDWASNMAKAWADSHAKIAADKGQTYDYDKFFNLLLTRFTDFQKTGSWASTETQQEKADPRTNIDPDELIGTDKAQAVDEA